MNIFLGIVGALLLGFICWGMISHLRRNPELLSKQNIAKSFSTMGVLALILIVFIAFLVFVAGGGRSSNHVNTADPAALDHPSPGQGHLSM